MESTLALSFDALRTSVADFLGYGRTSTNWSSGATARINEAMDDGLRQFYHPPVVPPARRSYMWSFLRPVGKLITVATEHRYDMPIEYAGMDGDFIYDSTTLYRKIQIVGEGQIRELRSGTQTSGVPQYAAIFPKPNDGEGTQRFEVTFWPTPDAAYTLTYRYVASPNAVSSEKPFPLGGEAHSDTIKQSCLAAAEFLRDDERGIHYQRFMEMLSASISRDAQLTERKFYGYNGDGQEDHSTTLLGRRYLTGVTPPTT